jgi:hypothetical protein
MRGKNDIVKMIIIPTLHETLLGLRVLRLPRR